MKRVLALVGAAALALTACGGNADTGDSPEAPAVVFAAASLTKPFEEMNKEAKYSFGGSSGLVDQLVEGAPADVFVSADKKNMDRAVSEGLIEGEPVMFATNYLVLATPADNPAGVTGLDASLDNAKLVVCAPEVPCGNATGRITKALGITLKPVSEEQTVTDVLGKVVSGEADAGLVYMTDAKSAGDKVKAIDIPGAKEDPNTYWIATVKGGNANAARVFIGQVMGDGQKILENYGFGAPVE